MEASLSEGNCQHLHTPRWGRATGHIELLSVETATPAEGACTRGRNKQG